MEAKKQTIWSRSDWLEQSLELFVREGSAQLSLSRLAGEFGLTKGSFYWHFKDVADFRAQLIEYWHEALTVGIARAVDEVEGGPAEKLKHLLRMVVTESLGRFHHIILSLAASNPELEPAITESLEYRRRYISRLFVALGFSAQEARIRASLVLSYGMLEGVINRSTSRKQRLALVNSVWKTLTQLS